MNEDVLWYAARVSGLMAWVLACGCLICSLLVRSPAEGHHWPARLWADDARRFFGFSSLLFAAGHTASVVISPMFDLSAQELISLRQGEAWLDVGVMAGVLCGCVILAASALRLFEHRLPSAAGMVTTVLTAAVVAGGVYHGWSLGSDVRNPVAVVAIGVAALAIMATAGLAVGSAGQQMADDGSTGGSISVAPDGQLDNGTEVSNRGPSSFPVPEVRSARLLGRPEPTDQGPGSVARPEKNPPA